jgi:hypothetical protein
MWKVSLVTWLTSRHPPLTKQVYTYLYANYVEQMDVTGTRIYTSPPRHLHLVWPLPHPTGLLGTISTQKVAARSFVLTYDTDFFYSHVSSRQTKQRAPLDSLIPAAVTPRCQQRDKARISQHST